VVPEAGVRVPRDLDQRVPPAKDARECITADESNGWHGAGPSIVRKFSPAVVSARADTSPDRWCMPALLGIPTVIQDQNGAPGATTKFLSRRVTEVHLTLHRRKNFCHGR